MCGIAAPKPYRQVILTGSPALKPVLKTFRSDLTRSLLNLKNEIGAT